MRCDQDPSAPDAPCRRCAKANRSCVYSQAPRKRQKKSDTRVADLEKKLDALTSAIQAQQYAQYGLPPLIYSQGRSPEDPNAAVPQQTEPNEGAYRGRDVPTPSSLTTTASATGLSPQSLDLPNKRRKTDSNTDPVAQRVSRESDSRQPPCFPPRKDEHNTYRSKDYTNRPSYDFASRYELWPLAREEQTARILSIVDESWHARIFDRFVNECVPTLPAVCLPPGTTAKEILDTKPILLLAILSTAGYGLLPAETSIELFHQMLEVVCEIAIRQGTSSLELVQALLVVVLWIKAPDRAEKMPERSGFYLTVHMAITMAIDLGLGRRYKPNRARKGFSLPERDISSIKPCNMPPDSDSIEARRTWLACFYCAAAASMALRRPNLLRWTAYMQECVEVLEKSPDALPSDALFCQYVRLQKICDEISVAFQMDDPSATAISISDPKVSYTIDVYEQKLKEWERNLSQELRGRKKLMFFYDVAILYLHEIALHVNHNVDDFQLPFTEEGLRSGSQHSEILTHRQMKSLEACLNAAHSVIATYCDFGVEAIGTTPTLFYFVRCMYALVVLIKMHLAVMTPGSEVAKIIKPENVRVIENMEKIWTLFQEMQRHPSHKAPPKAVRSLGMLRDWLVKHKDGDPPAKDTVTENIQNSKNRPFGRNPHGVPQGSSKLQVLSEAATAGHDHGSTLQQFSRHGSQSQQDSPSTNREGSLQESAWTFDSPDPFGRMGPHASSGRTSDTTPNATPQMGYYTGGTAGGQQQQPLAQSESGKAHNGFYTDMFGASTGMMPSAGESNDWAAGMDLDQLLNGAFEGFDASGDMGGWFLGDGIGAYQLPADGVAPTGNGSDNTGRW